MEALENGVIPIGKRYSTDIYKCVSAEDDRDDSDENKNEEIEQLRQMLHEPSKYDVSAFNMKEWKKDIESDVAAFKKMQKLTVDEKSFAKYDDKLHVLEKIIDDNINDGDHKMLIFSESSVTVRYVHGHLAKYLQENHSGKEKKLKWIDSSKSQAEKLDIVRSFDTENNPAPKGQKNKDKYDILISTDVLSEGINLQAAKKVVSYDFHWNPVKLMQRIGRVNRIGSEFAEIDVINFLPTTQIEEHLGIKERVGNRIKIMRETIGMGGGVVLQPGEENEGDDLDEDGAAACYDGTLEDGKDIIDSKKTQAEIDSEKLEQDKKELGRIKSLPDGLRAVAGTKKLLVFCEAVETRYEDENVISEKPFRQFYEAYDDEAHRIWETTLKDKMAKNSDNPGIPMTDEMAVQYYALTDKAWSQFEIDMDNMSLRQTKSKWQKYFQNRLERMAKDDKNNDMKDLAIRIGKVSNFIGRLMFADRDPYRSLAALYQKLDREASDDETMLLELERLERNYKDKNRHRRSVRKPRIVCSMMVDE